MIDPASSRLWIIDLESATLADDCPARIRYCRDDRIEQPLAGAVHLHEIVERFNARVLHRIEMAGSSFAHIACA
jgi:hypothetical protein